jgi:hypothetical protein
MTPSLEDLCAGEQNRSVVDRVLIGITKPTFERCDPSDGHKFLERGCKEIAKEVGSTEFNDDAKCLVPFAFADEEPDDPFARLQFHRRAPFCELRLKKRTEQWVHCERSIGRAL